MTDNGNHIGQQIAEDTDREILLLLQNPDSREQGFRLLMKWYGPKLYWHIRRIVVGHEDAEDVFQETSIKIYQHTDSFKGGATQLRAWLYRIATHEALQLLRRQTHIFQSIDDLAPTLTDKLMTESPIQGSEPETLLQKVLLSLPTTQRLAFNMRYFDDLSYEEIARITGKHIGTLKTSYHYAAERIRKLLKDNI